MPKTLLEELADLIDPVEAAFFDLADLVAERVAELLHSRGWTQRELARRLDKPESYVSRLLAGGQNPTLRTLAELQHAFGEAIVTTPAQVARETEDAYGELDRTLVHLTRSTAEPPVLSYDPDPALAGGPWLLAPPATATALGTSRPGRFLYPAAARG